jgi:hypothetical protein
MKISNLFILQIRKNGQEQRAESPLINSAGQRPAKQDMYKLKAPQGRNQNYYKL